MNFPIIDLISQAIAIEAKLAKHSDPEIMAWLQKQGKLSELETHSSPERKIFRFHSHLGMEATFFMDNGKFFFIGDHHTFRPRKFPG